MPDDGKTGLRRFFTMLTSPIWVPVTVAASLVPALFQAIADFVDVADRTKSSGAGWPVILEMLLFVLLQIQ